jgi:hypothetical protein
MENVVNSTVNAYGHNKIFPRGLPLFADKLLRGTVRFAKRTGNSISVLNPDNTFDFATIPSIRDNKVILERTTPWITVGAIISLGPGKELHKVFDIIDETIILEDEINRTFTDQDQLLLHSYPMVSALNAAIGDTVLTVKSHFELANGDIFALLQTEGLLQSLTEIRITKATLLGSTTDLFFTKLYSLELEAPIGRAIKTQSEIFHRAYPAYFSASVRVPNAVFTSDPIGPFLIDTLSGKLLEGDEFRETISLKTINRTGGFVTGSTTDFVTVDKNHIIMDRTLNSHVPMFWELAEGTMRISPNRVLMRVNTRSQFSVGYKCVPFIPADKSWRISLIANEDCTIRFFFNPHPFQEFSLTSGIAQTVTVTIPAGDDVSDIEINILGLTDICEVQLSDWTPLQDTVEQLQYSIVVEATGVATYQSTGVIVKPYFLGSEFLKTTYDVGENYDSGKVYF